MQTDDKKTRRLQRYSVWRNINDRIDEVEDPDGEHCRADDVARLEDDYAEAAVVAENVRSLLCGLYLPDREDHDTVEEAKDLLSAIVAKAEGREGSDG